MPTVTSQKKLLFSKEIWQEYSSMYNKLKYEKNIDICQLGHHMMTSSYDHH